MSPPAPAWATPTPTPAWRQSTRRRRSPRPRNWRPRCWRRWRRRSSGACGSSPTPPECVTALAFDGVPLGVASTSRRDRLDLTLGHSGLARYFQATVAGDEVARGKPAPDVYLAAAERLGVRPVDCLAIEDTGLGAAAAVAAGMRVIGVARLPGEVGRLLGAGAGLVDRLDPTVLARCCSAPPLPGAGEARAQGPSGGASRGGRALPSPPPPGRSGREGADRGRPTSRLCPPPAGTSHHLPASYR